MLDTYSSAHNRVLNHTMMAVHCWAGAVLVAALLVAGAAVGSCVAGAVGCWAGGGGSSSNNRSSSAAAAAAAAARVAAAVAGLAAPGCLSLCWPWCSSC